MTTTAAINTHDEVEIDIDDYEALLTDCANVQSDLSELKANLAFDEANMLLTIAEERGPDGKPRYPNADARAAAIVVSLGSGDDDALHLASNIAERERALGLAKARATAQEYRVKAGLAWLRFLAKGDAE